jgi:hypothetical protein
MTFIHRLNPTIDVFVKNIGWCKAITITVSHEQMNDIWKCRRYDNGRVINAYDDQLIIAANPADEETDLIPEEWKPKQ